MRREDFQEAKASRARSFGSRDSWASHFAQGLPTSTPFVNAPDHYACKHTSQGATERCLPGQKMIFVIARDRKAAQATANGAQSCGANQAGHFCIELGSQPHPCENLR